MFKTLITAMILMVATPVFAEQSTTRDQEGSVCYNYHRDPRTCGNLWYCQFDFRTQLCNYVTDDTTPRSCASYDYDPYLCNNQRNCQYDTYARRCRDNFGPGPGTQCWQYNNDPRRCDADRDCSYDRRTRTCQDDFNPDPDPIGTETISCYSSQYRYSSCPTHGEVVSAYILQQHSSAQCVEGRTWGFDNRGIWVDQGCQATFKVRTRNGYGH